MAQTPNLSSPLPTESSTDRETDGGRRPSSDDALQGEGNYTAARRYDEAVRRTVESGKVDEAAHEAAPKTEEEAEAMRQAEQVGRRPAKH